jgi:hypothetical protein
MESEKESQKIKPVEVYLSSKFFIFILITKHQIIINPFDNNLSILDFLSYVLSFTLLKINIYIYILFFTK